MPEQRQAGPQHQPGHAALRAVVGAGGIGRLVEERHQHGRKQRDGDHGPEQPVGPLAEQGQQPDESEGPEQVELLLDGQRPQVPEQRRPFELVEVGRVIQDQVPVHRVGERREQVAAEPGQLLADEQHADRSDHDQQGEHRREQAPGPAEPEVPDPDLTRAAVFAQQQHRDEVAADHEEHLDPEEPAAQPARIAVVHEDGDHGERAQAVQPREVRDRLAVRGSARSGGGERHVSGGPRTRRSYGRAWSWWRHGRPADRSDDDGKAQVGVDLAGRAERFKV